MRPVSANEIGVISGGCEADSCEYSVTWGYDMTDVVDDISSMAILGIGLQAYFYQSFNAQVAVKGATLGAMIGAAYGMFNYVGYKFAENH